VVVTPPDSTAAERESPKPDLLWQAEVSGLLRDLTREVLALTEVVMAMNEKLAEKEEQ